MSHRDESPEVSTGCGNRVFGSGVIVGVKGVPDVGDGWRDG